MFAHTRHPGAFMRLGIAAIGMLIGVSYGCSDAASPRGKSPSDEASKQLIGPVVRVTVTLNHSRIAPPYQAQATATAYDLTGDAVSGRIVVWLSSNNSVATVSQSGVVTPVNPGTAQIRAIVDGITGSATITVTTTPEATHIAVTRQPAGASSGSDFTTQPVVEFRDLAGNRVTTSSASVTAQLSAGSGAFSGTATVSAVQGVVTYNNLRITGSGPHTLSFSSSGLPSTQSSSFTVAPPAPTATQLSISTQPSSAAEAGVAFAQQPVIQLRDASNNAISQSGVVVTASINAGGGALGGTTTATTNASGVATFTNLSITGVNGSRTLLFSAPSLSSVISTAINVTNRPTPPTATRLTITTQPSSSAFSGAAFAQQPVIQLRDASNNVVSESGVVVTATIATGGGTLGGTTTATTNASGVASFTNLSITGADGSRTLQFAAPSLTAATSSAISVTQPPQTPTATKLTITTQPSSSAQTGTPFAQQPVIQLRDAANNAVSQSGVVVTATIASGGGTLGGTTTATTNASGVATFTNLSISGSDGSRTLQFSAPSLTSVISNAIAVAGPPPTALSITTQPSSSAQSGVAFAQQPVIQLRDASNNAVARSGIVVTAQIATGAGGRVSGTTSATTNASGAASFTNLSITGDDGPYTLHFSAPSLTAVVSNSIAVTDPTPTKLTITTQPSSAAQSGQQFAQQPVIQLRDASNNAAGQAGVAVTAAIATGGGTLGGTATATTNASGIATFTNLSITGTDGSRTISFTAAQLTGATSNPVLITAQSGSTSPYFNSSEPGCDGSDPNVLFCEDFEVGNWYTMHCDQANSSGGIDVKTRGWCGTIYNQNGLANGTARCSGAGFRSTCAATTGLMSGSTTGNMADHALRQGVEEVWVRFYTKPLSGYEFGAEKMVTFNDGKPGDGGIKWGNLSWNCATHAQSTGNLTMGFPLPMDVCQSQNTGNNIVIQSGNWYFYEVHYKLSSPGGSNGVFELWVDNCGPTGTSCPATPTLRMRRTDVQNNRSSTSELIRVLWFEAWSNPVSRGERYLDQIKASRAPIGFMP